MIKQFKEITDTFEFRAQPLFQPYYNNVPCVVVTGTVEKEVCSNRSVISFTCLIMLLTF